MSYFINAADEAESAFYSAFEHLDLELMRSTWSDSANVYCIHPGGPVQEGRDIIMQQWAFIFQDAEPPAISYEVLQRSTSDDTAIHLVKEKIGPNEDAAVILATNVYQKTPAGWRMIAHHASLPPNPMTPAQGELH